MIQQKLMTLYIQVDKLEAKLSKKSTLPTLRLQEEITAVNQLCRETISFVCDESLTTGAMNESHKISIERYMQGLNSIYDLTALLNKVLNIYQESLMSNQK